MSRFFQHIHKDDPMLGEVTELARIDDSDPDITLYYFTDGTKCNPLFIADINDTTAFEAGKVMAELSSITNKWEFDTLEVKKKQYFTTNQSGDRCEVVDPYMQNKTKDVKRVTVKRPPRRVDLRTIAPVPQVVEQPKPEEPKPQIQEQAVESPLTLRVDGTRLDLTQDGFNEVRTVAFMKNGALVEIGVDELMKRLTEEPKPAQKIAVDTETHLELSIDATQKTMVDNMIDMAKKMECAINIELGLNIPPKSVYGLINSGYPEEISDAFVKILADRIHIRALKQAVADGLLEYYIEGDED